MKKIVSIVIGVAIVVGGGGFYGGMKYAQAKRGNFGNLTAEQRQQFAANGGAAFRAGQRGGANGGLVSGQILSKDDTSITIKLRDGGSKIVLYSDKTEVGKFVNDTSADLEVGKNVSANGTSNQDGSLTAQSIQIRPDLPSPTPNQ
jgi:hypothetical protein